jgi:hypothetical protein
MASPTGDRDSARVWLSLALILAVFWGLVCFGPPFMRDFMGSVFSFLITLLNI